ncbi:MAG: YraN family protein [Actinobacteria bacterium]|nr:YraN family protein [Actinomycetota bacterium]
MSRPPPELRRGRGLNNRLSGAWGEELALRYLTRRGYVLIERNYRTRYGELDLILRHENTIVFVEVKLRRGTGFGHPLEAVTPRKQASIRSLAQRYLLDRRPSFDTLRFDVVGILVGKGTPRIVHVEDAF